jgi:uncharacterized surface protein with fasciclin (FAS1) repeats
MRNLIVLFFLALATMISSCKSDVSQSSNNAASVANDEHQGQAAVKDDVSDANALQLAQSLEDFTTLVSAIEAAGVQDAVVNAGPLTIFAPLNSAFNKLPEGTVEELVKPENKSQLAFILTNHVAPANFPEDQLMKEAAKRRKLYMASGNYLEVVSNDEGLFVGGTKILKTVRVSNGWIHVIDDVLVPQN